MQRPGRWTCRTPRASRSRPARRSRSRSRSGAGSGSRTGSCSGAVPDAPARLNAASTARPSAHAPISQRGGACGPGQERQGPRQRQQQQHLVGGLRGRSRWNRPRAATGTPSPRRPRAVPSATRAPRAAGRARPRPSPPPGPVPPPASPPDTSRAGSIRRCWAPGRATARATGTAGRTGTTERSSSGVRPRRASPGRAASAPATSGGLIRIAFSTHPIRVFNRTTRYTENGARRSRSNRSIRMWRNEKSEGMMSGGDEPGRGRKPLRVSLSFLT